MHEKEGPYTENLLLMHLNFHKCYQKQQHAKLFLK